MAQYFDRSGMALTIIAIIAVASVGLYVGTRSAHDGQGNPTDKLSGSVGGLDIGLVKLPASTGTVGIGLIKTDENRN